MTPFAQQCRRAGLGIAISIPLMVGGSLLVAGLIPVWAHDGMSANEGLLLAAGATAAAGILDHRLLVRTFGPSRGRARHAPRFVRTPS